MIAIGEVVESVRVPDRLVWRLAEVTTHPQGGYTVSVPVAGSARRLYRGQWDTAEEAQVALVAKLKAEG